MANKRRPKKYKVPFRKYGPNGYVSTKLSANDFRKNAAERAAEKDMDIYYSRSEENVFYTYTYGETEHIKQDYYEDSQPSVHPVSSESFRQYPEEILAQILMFVSYPNGINLKFFLVSKQFFRLCLPLLYETPVLNSLNFNKFVDSMTNTSSVSGLTFEVSRKYFERDIGGPVSESTQRRLQKYAKTPLVKQLDLSNIIQAGKNSNITKLLRRCLMNLTYLVAPQTSFGITSLSILKMCHNLVVLDLSLVSETVNLLDLFISIKELKLLKTLKFPRSSINCNLNEACDVQFLWPVSLENLRLSGGITNEFLMDLKFPDTLRELELQHCPLVNDYAIYYLLAKIGRNLKRLSIVYPMPGLKENSLDLVFKYCPFLEKLETFVDYISQWMFTEVNLPWIINAKHLPNYKFNRSRDTVIQAPVKRAYLVEPEDFDLSLQDHIITTSTNYFEAPDSEDEDSSPFDYEQNGLTSLRPLKTLYLGSSGTLGQANKIHPDDILIALSEKRLPFLSLLQVSNRVGWNENDENMEQLVDLFEDQGGSVFMCP